MVQCKKCKLYLSIAKDDVLKCKGACEGVFHKKCIRNIKAFLQKEVCEFCLKGENSPNPQASEIIVEPGKTSPEAILGEVNKKLEIIFKIEKRLEELTGLVDFYSEQYQAMTEFKQGAQKKISALENKNVYLEKCNKALEERILLLEQKDKDKNIELACLEKHANENLKAVVSKFAEKLNLQPNDIVEVKRVGAEKPLPKNSDIPLRPQPVIVTLRSKAARDQWIQQRRTRPRITNGCIYGNDSKQTIFINEDVTQYTRQLFWSARNQLKTICNYIWIQNAKILVRKSEEEKKIYNIKNEDDIKILIKQAKQSNKTQP